METQRNLLAVFLISIIIILTPKWISLFSPNSTNNDIPLNNAPVSALDGRQPLDVSQNKPVFLNKSNTPQKKKQEKLIFIDTDLFFATLSNQSGGSILSYKLKNYNSSFNIDGLYSDSLNVELINSNNASGCMPCLRFKDGFSGNFNYLNSYFDYSGSDTVFVSGNNFYELSFSYTDLNHGKVNKSIFIKGDSYVMNHSFSLTNASFNYSDIVELSWINGILPTEKIETEDVDYASFIANFGEDFESFYYTKPDSIEYSSIMGNTAWVGIKNKYFLMSLIPDRLGSSGSHSYKNIVFGDRKITPLYSAFISFPASNNFSLSTKIYLGPLQYNTLKNEAVGLENAINFGWKVVHPFTKGILFLLMFLKQYINNYGVVLILFAFIIRIITGPLTKKAALSSQKMQTIQPQLKKLQTKFSGNPQKLNTETIALYKNSGVNPLGGCLPVLIQMPLLFSLFMVFRTTIEFRGASFLFWIKDLSQPDAVFDLPFNIPLYGSSVCVLPFLMSITMFIQQSYSMASNTDKNQKIMMQSMSVVFFLIFNSFPSGLNLYYTVSNILNIFQQRSLKKNSNS